MQVIDNASGNVLKTLEGVCDLQWLIHIWHVCNVVSIVLPQDTEPVTSLAWGPKDGYLMVASRSLQLRAFSLESGKPIRSFKGHRGPVAHIAMDGSQTLMATASVDKSVKVWDIEGGYCTHSFSGHRYVFYSAGKCMI